MKTIKRTKLSTIHMVQGGENKHPIVILDGILKQWIGFGWVDEGKASIKDKQKYPTVKD